MRLKETIKKIIKEELDNMYTSTSTWDKLDKSKAVSSKKTYIEFLEPVNGITNKNDVGRKYLLTRMKGSARDWYNIAFDLPRKYNQPISNSDLEYLIKAGKATLSNDNTQPS